MVLRDLPQLPNQIVIAPHTRQRLVAEAGRSRDTRECGGWLVGHAFERGVQVIDLVGQGLRTKRERSSMELVGRLAEEFVSQFDESIHIIGCWHTHLTEDHRPSDLDLEAWRYYFEVFGEPCRAALILTPDLGSGWVWAVPRLHAWMVRRSRRETELICEPATVVEAV